MELRDGTVNRLAPTSLVLYHQYQGPVFGGATDGIGRRLNPPQQRCLSGCGLQVQVRDMNADGGGRFLGMTGDDCNKC